MTPATVQRVLAILATAQRASGGPVVLVSLSWALQIFTSDRNQRKAQLDAGHAIAILSLGCSSSSPALRPMCGVA